MGIDPAVLRIWRLWPDTHAVTHSNNPNEPMNGPPAHVPERAFFEEGRSIAYLEPNPARPESPFGPGGIGGFLKRRKWTILLGFVLVTGAVAAVLYMLPPRYVSTVTFLVEPPSRNTGSEALAVLERLGQTRSTETEVELLQGRRVVEPVVDRLDLHVRVKKPDETLRPDSLFPSFSAGPDAQSGTYTLSGAGGKYQVRAESGEVLAGEAPGGRLSFAGLDLTLPAAGLPAPLVLEVLPFSEAVEQVQERIAAAPAQRQADLVRLTCEGPTASAARDLCQEAQESYTALRTELQRSEASAAADFLNDQVARVRQRLTRAEDSLQAYQAEHRAIALEERASQAVTQYAHLQARRGELRAERNALGELLRDIESDEPGVSKYRRLASFPTFIRSYDNVISRLVESLVELENRRSDLAVRRTERDPDLVALNERIREIEDQILSSATSYYESLNAQIRSVEQTVVEQGRELAVVPEQAVELARLQRRIAMLEDLYGFLQTRLQEAEVVEAVTLPSVRVVDRPSLPHEPSFPNIPITLALGAVLGLGMGLLGGFWREHTDQRVRTRQELSGWGLPVLTMVPHFRGSRLLPPSGSGGSDSRPDPQRELVSESFRTLAFELEAAGRRVSESGIRSVAITSPARGEGKTFCALNLAMQVSGAGRRPLLVDGDIRAQGLSRLFELAAAPTGLSSLAHTGADVRQAVTTVELESAKTLDVIPSGRGPTGAWPPLSATIQRVIEQMNPTHDLVIVDTPPLNVLTDAARVATAVDAVILVVRTGSTEREALEHALERIQRTGASVLGVVLNDTNLPDYYTSYSQYAHASS